MSIAAVGWLRSSAGIDVAGSGTPIVMLNVGGTIHTTHAKTLAPFADGCPIFRDAVNGSGRRAPDGSLVVDRDGKVFRHVLNFMRNGNVLVLPDDFHEWDLLLADSRYFGIRSLEEAIVNNFDYQRRTFRRQLPTNVMLKWESVTVTKNVDPSPPATTATGGDDGNRSSVTVQNIIALNPPIPALAVDHASGLLLYHGAAASADDCHHGAASSSSLSPSLSPSVSAVQTLDEALRILCTSYGYTVSHWEKSAAVVQSDEEMPASNTKGDTSPTSPPPSSNTSLLMRRAQPPAAPAPPQPPVASVISTQVTKKDIVFFSLL